MKYPVTCIRNAQKISYVMELNWRINERVKTMTAPEAQALYGDIESQVGAELPGLLATAKAAHVLVTMKMLDRLGDAIVYPVPSAAAAEKLLYLEGVEEALRLAHNVEGDKFRNGDPPYAGPGGEAAFRYYQSSAGWHGKRGLILGAEMANLRKAIERADEWNVTDQVLDELAATAVPGH